MKDLLSAVCLEVLRAAPQVLLPLLAFFEKARDRTLDHAVIQPSGE